MLVVVHVSEGQASNSNLDFKSSYSLSAFTASLKNQQTCSFKAGKRALEERPTFERSSKFRTIFGRPSLSVIAGNVQHATASDFLEHSATSFTLSNTHLYQPGKGPPIVLARFKHSPTMSGILGGIYA